MPGKLFLEGPNNNKSIGYFTLHKICEIDQISDPDLTKWLSVFMGHVTMDKQNNEPDIYIYDGNMLLSE